MRAVICRRALFVAIALAATMPACHRDNADDAAAAKAAKAPTDTGGSLKGDFGPPQGPEVVRRATVGRLCLHDDRDVASASTATYGVRWTGTHLQEDKGWGWTLESARQHEYAGNPLSFSHAY
jgi:hypothetical protein